jgi:hypothetical protein
MSAGERSGFRDEALVGWHCVNHLHCRAAGVQLLMLEYNHGLPVALVDYRRYEDGVPNTDHPIYRALITLAGTLPFVIVYYDRKTWGMCVAPQNLAARRVIGPDSLLSEAEYVEWLHEIRGGEQKRHDFPRGLGRSRPKQAPWQPMSVPMLLSLNGAAWPGEELSHRHREFFWGRNCPVVDLDYLLIDNNDATPLAIIEYKFHLAPEIDWRRDTNIKAQRVFAGKLPFRVVRYWRDGPWKFQVLTPPTEHRNDSVPEFMDAADWRAYLQSRRAVSP